MDTKIKEALEEKKCSLIYAAHEDDGLEISYKGSIKEILSLVGTFMLSVSIEAKIPLYRLLVDLISSSTAAIRELEEKHEEIRKAGMN